MKRQTRLLALAEHLRGRKTGVTAESLAERFNVSLRTMYRDLETLQEAALPLKAERGRGGGYALDKSYFLPPVAFSAREAALLVALAEHALTMRIVPFAETTSSALDKLRAALSASAQRELLDHMKTLRFAGIPALPTKDEVRKIVEQAFFERAVVEVSYEGPRGEARDGFLKKRRVRLRNVVMEGSVVLLNVTDVDDGSERQLRMDRISAAAIVEGEGDTSRSSSSPSSPSSSSSSSNSPLS